jgi:hypothetical protein
MHMVLMYSYVGARSIQGMDMRVQFARKPADKLFRKIAKSDCKLHHVCLSVSPYAWNNSVPTGRTLQSVILEYFFENILRKFKLG